MDPCSLVFGLFSFFVLCLFVYGAFRIVLFFVRRGEDDLKPKG